MLAIVYFSPELLVYPRYAMHVLEYGFEKSSIATRISTCFLVNCVFCCFLCLLICLFHVLSFLSLFPGFSFYFITCFHLFCFSVCFNCFSFLFSSCHFCCFILEKNVTNPDHLHFDTLLNFADLYIYIYKTYIYIYIYIEYIYIYIYIYDIYIHIIDP